jgi:hypothetical protein
MKDEERFWNRFGGMVRKARNDCPLTPEEAQRELDALTGDEQEVLSKDEVTESIQKIVSGNFEPQRPEPDMDWVDGYSAEAVDEDVYALNRNLGEPDPETDAKIKELRKKASDEEDPDEQDETGMGASEKPPGKGR